MPEDDSDGDETDRHGDDVPLEDGDDQRPPSGERTPTEIGPDGVVSGDLPGDDAGGGEAGAPLSGLREDVERRRETDDDDFEELFTEMEVGGVDDSSDDVWNELSASRETPSIGADSTTTDFGQTADPVDQGRDVTVVEKRLCHDCPHFADPPQTACTHEGTTIDAEVDVDHFRVVDCPVVAAREDVEASDFSADES